MSQHKRGSHDSLSPEECERLVLSPPPVAFNPEKLKEFVSVNRALSAKRSLHSVNTNESTPVLPRHASIAWSHSEFDSKFKRYESELKSAVVPGGPQESDLKRNYQVSLNTAEKETSSSPVADSSEHAEDVSSTQLKKSGSIVRGKSSWKRLLCCVSAHTPIPEEQNRNILRPVSSRGESVQFAEDAPEVSTKITKSSKLSSLFKKKHRNGGPSPSPVKLRSVHKSPQIADERLKTPAPTLLVTRHNDPTVINETNHTHIEENGVAGCHLNVDDRISESTNSRDSIRSDDSYLGPIDQANPGEDLLGKPSPDCVGKKCLVLDLDETLVHSSFKPVDNADFIVTVEIENVQHEVSVCKRPHLETFIEAIGPLFEVVMFTASLSKYADPVCDRIDPSGHFKHRLFRESCVFYKSNYIKHLSILGRDIEQICIIDNSPISFCFHRQNALQIVTWFDDPTDTALLDLIPYLQGLAAAPSVLEYVSQNVPPPSAAIAQPDFSPWLIGAPSIYGNGVGYYDDEDEEEEDADVLHDGPHDARLQCREEDGGGPSSPHGIITMASRSSSETVTAT